jgi:ribulose-phosphate 3-epimerase
VSRKLLTGARVAPSILAADFAALRAQVGEVLDAGARVIHVDVMDGHFVPPITMGPIVVSALSDRVHDAGGMLDVHLMIERPERHVSEFLKAGADSITFHCEATPNVAYTASLIAEGKACVAVAINPATPVSALSEIDHQIDMALCMTVNPGWGGQQFIARSPEKISRLRALLGEGPALQVDGGIDSHTAPICLEAGANIFVCGSAVFSSDDPGETYRAIADSVGGV